MDAHELLQLESEICFAVLGAPGSAEFVLIDMAANPSNNLPAKTLASARGWVYCGVVAVRDGVAAAQCESDPGSWFTMVHASLAAAQLIADRLRPLTKSDALEWLDSLYSLRDTRTTT